MRFDDRVTGNLASYSPNAKKIHIEIDPSEINKNVRADVALIGDLRQILDKLLPLLDPLHARPHIVIIAAGAPSIREPHRDVWTTHNPWLREINAIKGTAAVRDIINLPDNGHLYAAHVIHDIWREAPPPAASNRPSSSPT